MKHSKIILASILASVAMASHAGCYSEGIRAGDVQKFSQKGVVNKSWEGELVMEGTGIKASAGKMVGGNIWKFSVTDPAVAKVIDGAVMSGKTVSLRYCQGYVTLWQTDTNYIITQAVERSK